MCLVVLYAPHLALKAHEGRTHGGLKPYTSLPLSTFPPEPASVAQIGRTHGGLKLHTLESESQNQLPRLEPGLKQVKYPCQVPKIEPDLKLVESSIRCPDLNQV